jgi:type I restriction enzyme M protein
LPKAKGNGALNKIKTELLFLERCLDLLKPGGRLGIVLPEGVFNNPSLSYVRGFCEDRAYVRAVVSLPPETFVSSGASVKASLLFMQKFTKKEQAGFNNARAAAEKECRDKYASEMAKRTGDLEAGIEDAKRGKDTARRKALQSDLRQYRRDMEERIQTESRALLKKRFAYPVFLYEAESVGITATGETDRVPNELFPNTYLPNGIDKTALELYLTFRATPKAVLEIGDLS